MNDEAGSRQVVDASVVVKLFASTPERHAEQARELLARWEDGRVSFVAPTLLTLEVLNAAARKWRFTEPALLVLVRVLRDLDIILLEPDLDRVAHWAARGLSAHDAAYVAVAEAERIRLVTDDEQIASIAGSHVIALADIPV